MVAITRLVTIFYNHSESAASLSARGANLKRLSICQLVRIHISGRFSARCLLLLKATRPISGSGGRVLARMANGFPHWFAHGSPVRVMGPRRLLRDTPVLQCVPSRDHSAGERLDNASPIPLMPAIQVSEPPLRSPPLPRGGLLFFPSDRVKSFRSLAECGNEDH
jgi:hypothetical protein